MVGNNSSGSNSIIYGVTRENLVAITCVLSDGSVTRFHKDWKPDPKSLLQQAIGEWADEFKTNESNAQRIEENFPKKSIHRRNTGYALDDFLEFGCLARLLCGSEGSLALIASVECKLKPTPPSYDSLHLFHFDNLEKALLAVPYVMKHKVYSCELMDDVVLDCTRQHPEYAKELTLLEGNPKAVLMVSCRGQNQEEALTLGRQIKDQIKTLTYAEPFYEDSSIIKRLWNLRKAGLGLLANLPGKARAVAVIEDTAVDVNDLPEYIQAFEKIMTDFGQRSVYYAHAGAGELHLRPILDLDKEEDRIAFKKIAQASATLVKQYRGSLSGEHGDGRLRAPFLKEMVGEECYQMMVNLKHLFDPENLLNPGKIIDAKPILEDLRTAFPDENQTNKETLSFKNVESALEMASRCNGSGDCRRPFSDGKVMCPSYRATQDEVHSTRGRANLLRELWTGKEVSTNEVKQSLSLCLSCKGCISECPSQVDMGGLKAHFLQNQGKFTLAERLTASLPTLNALGMIFPSLTNRILDLNPIKNLLNVHKERTLPSLPMKTAVSLIKQYIRDHSKGSNTKSIALFVDEFTNVYNPQLWIRLANLLTSLGYQIHLVDAHVSGRGSMSVGMVNKAKKEAGKTFQKLNVFLNKNIPVIGIEPSAISMIRDEYIRFDSDRSDLINGQILLFDEFIVQNHRDLSKKITKKEHRILLHGHCHQKAISSMKYSLTILSWIGKVSLVQAGCCGMAGAFGYRKESFELSKKIAELDLLPAIEQADENTTICATGISCQHQIEDFTTRKVVHPIDLLWKALQKDN
ncbi:MAG: FAD-linked oxidase C-terminal domain-containing protein, partial [Bacteroidota bacterium]|nr:FAD-linked oxidase C-terminal domain-containing protein [Bacteroidota bacterium]